MSKLKIASLGTLLILIATLSFSVNRAKAPEGALAAPSAAADTGHMVPPESPRVIVTFKPQVSVRSMARLQARTSALSGKLISPQLNAGVITTKSPAEARELAAQLRNRPDIASVEAERMATPRVAPNDPLYAEQKPLHAAPKGINAELAWSKSTGSTTTIAIIDSGITPHPELSMKQVAGFDFASVPGQTCDGDGWDADPTDEADASCPSSSDWDWHGTHVAGIAAAQTNNGQGIAGVAPNARILPIRVGRTAMSDGDIAAAIIWAAGAPVTGAPVNRSPATVINLSIGGYGGCPAIIQRAIDIATSRKTVVVAAAGNDGIDTKKDDAFVSCRGVIGVGASNTATGGLALFSNYGPGVTVAAPGTSVLSTFDRGAQHAAEPTYALLSGTSMATPHVAGVAALLKSAYPAMTPAQVKDHLVKTSHPFVIKPNVPLNAGILDAGKALTTPWKPALAVALPDSISLPRGKRTVTVNVLRNDNHNGRTVKSVGVSRRSCGATLCVTSVKNQLSVRISSAKWRGQFVAPYVVTYTDGSKAASTLTIRVR